MITEKMNIRMDSVFSDDKKHRFLLRRSWSREGNICSILMINPNAAECLITDATSLSVYNGIAKMEGYAALNIVNLYSVITPKIHFRHNSEEDLNHPDNDKMILKAVAESDVTILAWGTVGDNNNRVKKRILEVMEKLEDYKDKLFQVGFGGKYGLHPLSPQLRSNRWKMQPVDYDAFVAELKETMKKNETKAEEIKMTDKKEPKQKENKNVEAKETTAEEKEEKSTETEKG